MPGWYGLAGGSEFRPPYAPGDREVLRLATLSVSTTPSDSASARVLVFPTAQAHSRPDLAAQDGVRHFGQLGAATRPIMALRRDDMNDPALLRELDQTDVVYFCGGDPDYLLRQLLGTLVIDGLRELVARGGVVMGSSAGAMVLGAFQRGRAGGWEPALDLVPGVAVLPHHRQAAPLQRVRPGLPADILILGIPEGTTVLWDAAHAAPNTSRWRCLGAAALTIYTERSITLVPANSGFDLTAPDSASGS
jgi:cyanophycinase